jgi:hypothetical protein
VLPRGPAGPPGAGASVTPEHLEAIKGLLPPVKVEIHEGDQVYRQAAPLGQPIRIKLEPQ